MGSASKLAEHLALLIKGEIEVRDFPWIDAKERQALGALGMSMLKGGKPEIAKAAFQVLIDLEPNVPIHHLMHGHSASLCSEVEVAFEEFGKAIFLSASDESLKDVASEAFLARGELLLRLGRVVEARADLADALTRLDDPVRKRSIEAFLAS